MAQRVGDELRDHQDHGSAASDASTGTNLRMRPRCASPSPASLFEGDYLPTGHAKIYVGRSRHWMVAWLWFLS